MEKKRVSTQLVKLIFEQRLKEVAEPDQMSRKDKKKFLDDLKRELFTQCLPSISYLDIYWLEQSGDIQVFSSSSTDLKLFEEMFKKTFEFEQTFLLRIKPPLIGMSAAEWELIKDHEIKRMTQIAETMPMRLMN
jgi:hypothetical protein